MKKNILMSVIILMALSFSSCGKYLTRSQVEQVENRAKELMLRAEFNDAVLKGKQYEEFRKRLGEIAGSDSEVINFTDELERLIKLNTRLERLVATGLDRSINGPEGSPEISGH